MDDHPKVQRVHDGLGTSHIEPPLEQAWSNLERLRWHAAVTALDTGLQVLVHPVKGGYSVQVENGSMSSMNYQNAWSYISGVLVGGNSIKGKRDGT